MKRFFAGYVVKMRYSEVEEQYRSTPTHHERKVFPTLAEAVAVVEGAEMTGNDGLDCGRYVVPVFKRVP